MNADGLLVALGTNGEVLVVHGDDCTSIGPPDGDDCKSIGQPDLDENQPRARAAALSASGERVIAVGDGGSIWRYDVRTREWSDCLEQVADSALLALWEYKDKFILAGEGGVIIHWEEDRNTWHSETLGQPETIVGVSGVPESDYFIVATESGRVLRRELVTIGEPDEWEEVDVVGSMSYVQNSTMKASKIDGTVVSDNAIVAKDDIIYQIGLDNVTPLPEFPGGGKLESFNIAPDGQVWAVFSTADDKLALGRYRDQSWDIVKQDSVWLPASIVSLGVSTSSIAVTDGSHIERYYLLKQ